MSILNHYTPNTLSLVFHDNVNLSMLCMHKCIYKNVNILLYIQAMKFIIIHVLNQEWSFLVIIVCSNLGIIHFVDSLIYITCAF